MASTSFRYEPLASSDLFRLVRLKDTRPDQKPEDIEIELFDARFDESPDYEAISYAWGEESEKVVISCNGQSLAITPVVASILQALRHQDSIKTLWIDAISIDQSSIAEKNVQVPRHGSYESDVALDMLSQISQMLKTGSHTACLEKLDSFYPVYTESVRTRRVYYDPVDTNFIFDIINLPWFHRTWTVQEVVLGKFPMLLLGSKCLPWGRFISCLGVLQVYERRQALSQHDSLSNPASYHDEIQWFTSLRNALHQDTLSISLPLKDLRRKLSRDPRDKVYGLYGMFSDNQVLRMPQVDYAKSVQEIYTATTQSVIEHDVRLDVLYQTHLPHTMPDLPSWVPDWSNQGFIQPFNYNDTSFPRSQRLVSPPWIFEGPRLKVSGVILDKVHEAAISTSAAGIDFRAGYSVAVSTASPKENVIRLRGIVELVRTMQAWTRLGTIDKSSLERLLANILKRTWPGRSLYHQRGNGIKRWAEILSAKTNGNDLDLRTLVEEVESKNRSLYDSMKRHYMRMLGCSENVEDWPDELVIRMLLKLDSKDVASIQHDIALLTYQRTLFTTSDGNIGIGPRWCRKGDVVALIHGLGLPFLLRKTNEHYRILGPAFIDGILNDGRWDTSDLQEFTLV